MTEAIKILAKEAPILPALLTLPMLLVISPRALVLGIIGTHELAQPIPLVRFPVAQVVATIWINQASVAIMFIISPVAIVTHTVWPNLRATPMPLGPAPLASIDSLVLNLHLIAGHSLLVQVGQ